MDVNTLRQNWQNVNEDNEASVDSDGGNYEAFCNAWSFKKLGDNVRVQFDVMDPGIDRSWITINPAYVIMQTAYLIQSMRADGYEMVSYIDFNREMAQHHDMHNGSGIQMIFSPIK
jgi:hypothetical protein